MTRRYEAPDIAHYQREGERAAIEIEKLRQLSRDWIGQGPWVHPLALDPRLGLARVLLWAAENGLTFDRIEPDLVGGVSVYIKRGDHPHLGWVSIGRYGDVRSVMVLDGSTPPRGENAFEWLRERCLNAELERTAREHE